MGIADILHKTIGSVLVAATAGGLVALGYGVYSMAVERPLAKAKDKFEQAAAAADLAVLENARGLSAQLVASEPPAKKLR